MGLEITEVLSEDVAELREFMPRIIAETVSGDEGLTAEMTGNVLGNLNWWHANPEKCCHLKAVADGRIVGVILVKNFWNLCSLFVEPRRHRQGIGRALVMAGVDICRGKSERDALWLNAAPDAIPFYTRLGFYDRTPTRPLPAGFQAMIRPLDVELVGGKPWPFSHSPVKTDAVLSLRQIVRRRPAGKKCKTAHAALQTLLNARWNPRGDWPRTGTRYAPRSRRSSFR
jgi:GNAT superfamily N-acetyltransferase